MILQHNIPALNALRNNGINNAQTSSNLEKLSSGYRINRAADDAAGLAISEKMRSQIRGLGMAEQNTSNAVDLIQTAEGGLNEIHAILHRMRELAVQAANGTYVDDDREQITLEVDALKSEVDRIASSTHFNGINLLDGTLGGVGASIAPGTAGANDPLNSPTAYREGSKPAFAKMLENMGFVSSIDAGLDPEKGARITGYAALHLYDSSLAGSTANLIITSGSTTGGNAAVALQIGSTIYPAVISDGITLIGTAANQYVFLDDTGTPFAALLHNSSISDAAGPFELLKPTGDSGVINGITLTSPAAVFYNTLTDAGISTVDSALQNVVVAHDGSKIIFQIGANGSADQQVGMHVPLMGTANLGTFTASASNPTGTLAGISVRTREAANEALTVIDVAVAQVSSVRANLGAMQNRLEHTLNNLGVTKENLVAAESTIRDTDMAKEMMEFTKNSILTQASQAMLAQANSLPQGVLSLLS